MSLQEDIERLLAGIGANWERIKNISNRLQTTSKYTANANETRDINKLMEGYKEIEQRLIANPEFIARDT